MRSLEGDDKGVLQREFDRDVVYFRAINGRDIPIDEICSALPPGRAPTDKFTFVLERDGDVAGMIDIIRGYPEAQVWYLGFMFVSKAWRGGLGRRVLRGLYGWVKSQGGIALRLGVVEPNLKARRLYATEGFVFEAVREIDPGLRRMRRTLVLQRPL